MLVTAGWSWILLDRTPHWHPWIRTLVVVAAAGCVLALITGRLARPWARRLVVPVVALGLLACLAGPVAYAADTVTTAHTGSVPSAGPAVSGGFGGGGTFGANRSGGTASRSGSVLSGMTGTAPSGMTGTAPSGMAGTAASGTAGARPSGVSGGGFGGFSNEGGNLSLARFEQYVKSGLIHYYMASGGGGPGGGSSTSQITSWVKSHYKAVTIGGQTLYDLTQPRSA